jgi:LPXTG-motif cell wall-anchored protein
MKKVPGKSLAVAATSIALVVGVGAQPALAFQLDIHPPTGRNWNIDVESSETIADVKQKIADRSGWPIEFTCIVYANKALQNGRTLSEYNIPPGATFPWFTLPVAARWSITIDEPLLGGAVNNALETAPEPATFDIVDGSLPAGVTLDPDTGLVAGTFTEAGPFSATLRATNACGTAEVTWAGTVTGTVTDTGPNTATTELPKTGIPENLAPLLGLGATALIFMGSLLALRRARSEHGPVGDVRQTDVD